MNETRITLHGNVVSEPVERQARNGSPYTTFRVATTPYRRTADGRFVDGDTSFYDGTPGRSPQIDAAHIGHDLSWGRASFERVSRAAALGHDRTADPDVQASIRAMAEGVSAPTGLRPAHVDADGVVDDDYDPESDVLSAVHAAADDVLATGDPETDDYEVVEGVS